MENDISEGQIEMAKLAASRFNTQWSGNRMVVILDVNCVCIFADKCFNNIPDPKRQLIMELDSIAGGGSKCIEEGEVVNYEDAGTIGVERRIYAF